MSIMYLAVLMLCRELNYEPLDNEPTPITTRPDLFIMSFRIGRSPSPMLRNDPALKSIFMTKLIIRYLRAYVCANLDQGAYRYLP